MIAGYLAWKASARPCEKALVPAPVNRVRVVGVLPTSVLIAVGVTAAAEVLLLDPGPEHAARLIAARTLTTVVTGAAPRRRRER